MSSGEHAKLFEFIARCDDPKALKEIVRKARVQGEKSLEDAAFQKLIGLVPGEKPGTLDYDFWRMVNAFETMRSMEAGKTVRLSRTRQKVGRVGVAETLADWSLDGKETEGFRMLMERDLPELTGEAIVLRHPQRFGRRTVGGARRRLKAAGITDERTLWPLGPRYRCEDDQSDADMDRPDDFTFD